MQFAFRVSGEAVERSPTNGSGPRPVVKDYRIVGCSPLGAEQTASQLYLADLGAAGLEAAGDITVEAAPAA
jgi:hypothetical protein